jgi:hypothetical protein
MSTPMVNDLIGQYRHTFWILKEEISRFSDAQWRNGLPDPDHFQVPVVIAMHIYDCLDFYFREKPEEEYRWGHRFGGGYWELPMEKLPTQEQINTYATELEQRIFAQLNSLEDADLAGPPPQGAPGQTLLGHYIYAVRHTVHHHGELAALNVFNGNPGGAWDE